MGSRYSCYNCFSHELQSSLPESNLAKLPNDFDIMSSMTSHEESAAETESEAISKTDLIDNISQLLSKFMQDITQEPEKLGYKLSLSQNAVEVYLRDVPGGYSLLTIWKCSSPPSAVAKFLRLVDKRKEWDVHVSECKKICDITSDTAIFYTLYKRFLTMAPRDTLIVSKQVCLENAWVDVSTSIDSTLVPETTSIVRAKIVLTGYHIQPMTKDENGNITLVTSISEANFGQSLASGIVKNMSTSLAPKHVRAMKDAMKKFEKDLI